MERPQGFSISTHTGRLWITQTNHQEDILLEAGQVYVVQRRGTLVAEAMNHALISITGPAAGADRAAVSIQPQAAVQGA